MTRLVHSLCIVLVLFVTSTATAVTWQVPDDAPTIQAGIDSASYGDTVMVACGTYNEYNIYVKAGIYLTSETGEADCVTIDGQFQGYMLICWDIGHTTQIVGFTVMGGQANFGAGLSIVNSSPTISNCAFVDNIGQQQGGGVLIESSDPTLTNCTIANNACPEGGGMALYWSSPTIENTIIAFNTVGVSIYCHSSSPNLSCCDIYGNPEGDWVGCIAGQLGVDGNVSVDPEFCGDGNPEQPYTLVSTSPCAPENNLECGLIGALPVGCTPPPVTWHVPDDAPTIQAGIDSASYGDTVMVACGTYNEYNIYVKAGIYLTSETGEADCVTIDGQFQGYMFICWDIGHTTQIVGFTVMGGQANFGAGLSIVSSSPTISNCAFVDNIGQQQGGGVLIENSDPLLTNCTVANNACPEGGGMALYWSSPTIENTIIAFNTVGVSIYCHSSSPDLSCCDVYGNPEGDWVGCIADQLGINDNMSVHPEFCYDQNQAAPYTLYNTSPCAPDNNPECGLVGALSVGCIAPSSTRPVTWGQIKAMHRRGR